MGLHRALSLTLTAILSALLMLAAEPAGIEELTFKSDDIHLSGTIHWPSRPAKAGVVLIHGSAKADSVRMTALAQLLADRGFAVFTYDKRGIGRSGGTFQDADDERAFALLASDAVAAFETFAKHPQVKDAHIGLLGISQGGWVGPIAARRMPRTAFMVLWSGPVCTVSEEMHFSAKAKQIPNFSMRDHRTIMQEHMRSAPVREHDFDPREVLATLSLPVLWIYGGRDHSIPVELSITRIESMIEQGHANFEFKLFPEQGHGLNYPTEYPNGVEFMVEWIAKQSGASKP
jgi:dipeptidyl aminopeptidase/acylaminoacyl peptidase